MKLDLRIDGEKISVLCEIPVQKDSYSFALAHTLDLQDAFNNLEKITPDSVEPCEMEFRPPMKKYTFSGLQNGILQFSYSGTLEGFFLFMQEELYHYSLYNGWYPVGFDAEEDCDVVVHRDDSYELINGVYRPDSRDWYYSTKGQSLKDCNILLINKAKSFHSCQGKVSVWYFDQTYADSVGQILEAYTSINEFYVSLYGNDKVTETSIVILPEKYHIGAYQRDHLTVFSELNVDPKQLRHHLAHELGHNYAFGADCNTWEDWLNETHAEWSALLYELVHDPDFFEQQINEQIREYHGTGSLRPNGDQRPSDVHETGTLLYYDLYRKYGAEGIRTLLQTFDQLPIKNTAHFLNALSKKDERLCAAIQKHIESPGKPGV